jgi:hypothetical protein
MQFHLKQVRWETICIVGSASLLAGLLAVGAWTKPAPAAQFAPLGDVVPLDQLEIRADDVIRLATSLADAVRELKTAQLSVNTLQSLQPHAAVTGLETQIAQINVQTAQHKVTILRAIAEAQLAAARTRLDFLRRIGGVQTGEAVVTDTQTIPQVAQAEAMVRILQMILEIK